MQASPVAGDAQSFFMRVTECATIALYKTQRDKISLCCKASLSHFHRALGAVMSGLSYVIEKIASVIHRRKSGLSLNCLYSSASSLSTAVITRFNALSCSIFAFCLSEFFLAF